MPRKVDISSVHFYLPTYSPLFYIRLQIYKLISIFPFPLPFFPIFASTKDKEDMRRMMMFLLGMACWTSCSFRPAGMEELARIEPYVESCPDSARVLLDAVEPSALRGEARVYYNLLNTSVDDKLRVRHVSDSVMLRVVDYYQGRDPEKAQWAYYLLGRVYRDIDDPLEASKAFRRALKAFPESPRHDLLGRIYEQLFYLYSYQNAFPEALEMVNNSYQHYKIHNDSVGVAYALRNRARLYEKMGNLDSMEISYRDAARMAFSAGDSVMGYSSWRELAAMYVRYQRFDDSERLLAQLPEASKQHNGITLKNIADIYRYRQQPDSAYHYYQQASKAEYNNNIYLKREIYQALADLDSVLGGHSSFRYERLASHCMDSIRKLELAESVRDLDQQQDKIEKQELELENAWNWVFICELIICLLFLVEILSVCWKYIQKLLESKAHIQRQWNHDRRTLANVQIQLADVRQQLQRSEQMYKELKQTMQAQIAEWEEKERRLEESIQKKEEQIAQLRPLEKTVLDKEAQINKLQQSLERDQQALAQSQEEIQTLQDLAAQSEANHQKVMQALQQKEKELEAYSNLIQQSEEEKEKRQAELQNADIVAFFRQSPSHKELTPAKWDALKQAIEQASPHFTARLLDRHSSLTPQELHVCYLRKVGVSPKKIADLLVCSRQNITMIRTRLYEKLCKQKGTAKDFDAFIADF